MKLVYVMLYLSLIAALAAGADSRRDDFGDYQQGSDGSPNWHATSIGWEVRDGKYIASDAYRMFSIDDTLPMGRNVQVEATVVVKRKTTSDWKMAGLVIYIDERNYWYLALAEQPDGTDLDHYIELSQIYEGQWFAQERLRKVSSGNMQLDWQYDHPYRLTLSMRDGMITGSAHQLDGTLITEQAYKLDEQTVDHGRPGLDNGGFLVAFDDFQASVEDIVDIPEQSYPEYTQSNCTSITGSKTGFFHLEKHGDTWWVIDPNGHGFYIIGTDHVNYEVHWCEELGYAPYHRNMVAKYENEDAWAANTAARLLKWGFNSLGANNSLSIRYRGLAHTEFLSMGASFSHIDDIVPKIHWTGFPNVFSPRFEKHCDRVAREKCAPNRDDPWLLGYFIDNELEWHGKSYTDWGLWEEAFKKPPEHTAKQGLMDFLKERYPSVEDFNEAWETKFQSFQELAEELSPPGLPDDVELERSASEVRQDFVRLVTDKYFQITTNAIRKYDPNHIILGTRFADTCPDVWDIAGKYCDIVSVNTYRRLDLDTGVIEGYAEDLDRWYSQAGKPLMITEWSFCALDSGLPCTYGGGQRFDTQEQRAKAFSILQEFLFRRPYMVGSDYFMWVDQPAQGIADTFPENTNYGLVDVNDEPYQLLTQAATQLHRKVYEHHLRAIPGTKVTPEPKPPPPETSVTKQGYCRIQGKTYQISNGLMTLEKTDANGDMIDRIIVDGIDYGRFTPLIWQADDENRWARPDRIDAVESRMESECRELEITASFSGEDAGHLQVKYLFTIYPGTRWLKAQLISLTNTDSRPWYLVGYYQYALSNETDVSKLEYLPVVPNYYIPIGAWRNTELGTYYGVMTVDSGYEIRLWIDEEGYQHPDILRRIRRKLRPGEIYDAPQPPIFLFATEGDKTSYLSILEQIKRKVCQGY